MVFSTPVRLPQPTGHSQVHLRTGCEEEEEEKMTLENLKYGPTLSVEPLGRDSASLGSFYSLAF